MQDRAFKIEHLTAHEKLDSAISRIELAIKTQKEQQAEEQRRLLQVTKELDLHITNLEILLNQNKKQK